MMGNKEIIMLHNINKTVATLMQDFNDLVKELSTLTEMIYDREIEKCNDEIDIKLQSHM